MGPREEPVVGEAETVEAFCPFSYKKWLKVKDVNENLSPCLRQTGSCSHDQPKFWSMGAPIAGFATAFLSKLKW